MGRRCGPDSLAAPMTVLGDDTPCIDATWIEPQSRGNKINRVSFSVSIEYASQDEALRAAAATLKDIPLSGTLALIDNPNGAMILFNNATVREISPVQSGVAVDVRYAFAAGAHDIEFRPSIVTGLVVTPGTLGVELAWQSDGSAASYEVWAKNAESSDDPVKVLMPPASLPPVTHNTGDTINRTYYIMALSAHGLESGLSAGVDGAATGEP